MKIKTIPLTKLTLRHNEKLQEIIRFDDCFLSFPKAIHTIPFAIAQILLDSAPILALKNEQGECFQLALNMNAALLMSHPERHKLTINVHYYAHDEVDDVLIASSFYFPALAYREHNKITSHFFSRITEAKRLLLNVPTKKQLATLMAVSASTIRDKKVTNE